jgi:hypothetical protein
LRALRDPRNARPGRGEDDAGLPTVAFQPRKYRKRADLRQIYQHVKALGHCNREAAARNRMHGLAVGRDHAADEVAEIDPKLARGRAVNDAEPDPAAALDAHDLRIGERSIVGKEGVVMNIIQIHVHAARPRHVHS